MFRYQHLPSEESVGKCPGYEVEHHSKRGVQWKSSILGCLLGLIAGLIISTTMTYLSQESKLTTYFAGHAGGSGIALIVPPGNTPVTFAHNDTFELEPSEESDEAWETVIPSGMGFVQHPNLGPEIVGLAFVHQLHCVQRLREGYYSALHGHETNGTMHHVMHCLEYLRQAIMCHGDTNLEYREVKEDTREIGTSGYTEHHCRNFNELHDFAEKWRVWNGKNRPQQERISEEENIPGRKINYEYCSSCGDELPT